MISSQVLNDVAEYVDSRVSKVVLNGTYEITDFEVKQVTGSMMALNYIVPASSISLVTQIDLTGEAGELISSNPVYLPVSSDTLILQTIEVKEGN
ncbi:ketopantoate hydroxymethyltransferase [Paenibacillus sp. FSL W7-1279]|uniref:ketopantoate hydroxymethyltransferase n=1 Tax=unclassified Paenibacillus TaxID=185978 RepID=UPI0030D6EA8F